MNIKKSVSVTLFIYRDSKYSINYFPEIKQYGGIDYKYISSGKLNKCLNGLQLMLHNSIDEVIENIKFIEDMKYYQNEQGLTLYQALCMVYGLPYDQCKEMLFN